MKVSLSPLIGDARGSAGALSVFLSRAGLIAKINGMPYDPKTASQLLQRASLTSISQTWKSVVMNPYRTAWVLLAHAYPYQDTFGVTRFLSGSAMFAKLNRNLATINQSAIFTAPGSLACGAPGLLTLSYTPGSTPTFIVTPTTAPASTEAVVISCTKPLSAGVLTLGNTQTVIQVFPALSATPWDISTAYHTKHATVANNSAIFVEVHYVNISTGFAGQSSIDSVLT